MSRLSLEIVFAGFLALFGVIVMVGAFELEIGWDRASPQAGYFPFRVGALITFVAILIGFKAMRDKNSAMPFQVKSFLQFLCPLIALVLLIPYLGFYLAAALYLAVMLTLAHLTFLKTALIAVFTPAFLYISFEIFFKMPLPKGSLWSIIL